jgi:quercetin dioxygenase-like cupin family protein
VIVVDGLASLELERSHPVVYDREIGVRLLHRDPASGAEHYLVRYPAGRLARSHRHTAAHTIVVLEGRMQVNDRVVGPGAYCRFPAGETMRHAPAAGDSSLLLTLFDGPFDVQPVDD